MEEIKKLMEVLEKSSSNKFMREYFGNGKNAIRGTLESYSFIIGKHSVNISCNVVIYSYRWHKRVWSYYIDGELVNRAAIKRIAKLYSALL